MKVVVLIGLLGAEEYFFKGRQNLIIKDMKRFNTQNRQKEMQLLLGKILQYERNRKQGHIYRAAVGVCVCVYGGATNLI